MRKPSKRIERIIRANCGPEVNAWLDVEQERAARRGICQSCSHAARFHGAFSEPENGYSDTSCAALG